MNETLSAGTTARTFFFWRFSSGTVSSMWNCYALTLRTWSFETGDPWTNGFTTNWRMQEGSRLHLCVLHARTVLDTFIVLDEISHTGLRLLQDTDIERVRDNFRLNLEILDGKIRRGEQFSDSMPLPEAVAWEDCFCVRVVCYKCSLHDGQASACVFHAAGAFRQKKRRGRLSRTCCPTQGLRRESEWSQGFSPASTQQRQPGLQSRTIAQSVYAVPVHVPQDDQTETRRPIHHEGHCSHAFPLASRISCFLPCTGGRSGCRWIPSAVSCERIVATPLTTTTIL